jgi:hypothetical protein
VKRFLAIVPAVLGLVTVTSAGSAAAGDDTGQSPDSCVAAHAGVQEWPGTVPVAGGEYQVFSDGYATYLAGLPVCGTETDPASLPGTTPTDTCAAAHLGAQQWPGTIPVAGGAYQVFSDGYATYLAGLPVCAPISG